MLAPSPGANGWTIPWGGVVLTLDTGTYTHTGVLWGETVQYDTIVFALFNYIDYVYV